MMVLSRLAAAPSWSWTWLLLLGAGLVAADVPLMNNVEEFNRMANESKGMPHQKFRSSNVVAPIWNVNSWDKNLTDDNLHLFIGVNYRKVGNGAGPMIFDGSDLSLIYADRNYGGCFNSEMRTIHGERHLTFFAEGKDWIFDENYNLKHTIHATGGVGWDMHELQVNDEGTAVFTVGRHIDYDCSKWGGPKKCRMRDTGFQEVDLKTNDKIFTWTSEPHNDKNDTYARWEANNFSLNDDLEGTWDMVHTNGARKDEDGNYLISHRHLSSVQYIDGKTGDVIWTLGGKSNMFEDLSDGMATNIGWQHNAQFYHNHTHVTIFDNHGEGFSIQGACEGDKCVSRGLHVELDLDAMTARVVREFYHPGKVNSGAMGSMQVMENENVLIGWGWTPSIVEYAPDGTVAMDIQRGIVGITRQSDMFAYRAFKGPWTGRPSWPPAMVVDKAPKSGGQATIYMSWNGATDIKKWHIFSSDWSNPAQLVQEKNKIAESPRQGFETVVKVDPEKLGKYVVVAAVDKDGKIFGTSQSFNMAGAHAAPEDEDKDEKAHGHDDDHHDHDDDVEGDGEGFVVPGMLIGGVLGALGVVCVGMYVCFHRQKRRAPVDQTKYMALEEQAEE